MNCGVFLVIFGVIFALTEEKPTGSSSTIETTSTVSSEETEDTNDDNLGMENPDLFEGDIAGMTLAKAKEMEAQQIIDTQGKPYNDPNLPRFSALKSASSRWPGGIVPYKLGGGYSTSQLATIAGAMDQFHKKTCIKFVKRTNEKDYLNIRKHSGCYSYLGRVRIGPQTVSLTDGCVYTGIIIHEFLHALGFIHEQSRADRDSFVNILWDNIEDGLDSQFSKFSITTLTYLNTSYDYGSVMHYGAYYFSKNGKPTIQPLKSGVTIGQRNGFSPVDLLRVNRLYQCDQQASTSTKLPTTTTTSSAATMASTNLPLSTAKPTATTTAAPPKQTRCPVKIPGTRMRSLKNGCWYLFRDYWYFGIAR